MRCARSLAILLLLLPFTGVAQEMNRRMAVTVDDLPTVNIVDDSESGKWQVTSNLLGAFFEHGIHVTGFVNEAKLAGEDGQPMASRVELLRRWLADGHDLGNHTYSHPDLHAVPLSAFQSDVLQGETVTRPLLAEFDKRLRYFRHPFLRTGRDLDTKKGLEKFLDQHGYRVAPVSIDNSEWIFARAYVMALRGGDESMAERVGRDYVEYMLEMIDYYEDQSRQLFDRNISHVLLVHANQLNADWFGVLAGRIAELGYEFVTLDEALQDPAYQSSDTYTGPGGITWLHRWAITRNVDPSMFGSEPRTPAYVLDITRLPEHVYEAPEDP